MIYMPNEPQRPSIDDQTLALQAKHGCMDSFEELVRRYQTPLLHFLVQFGDRTDAEDIAQDTFIRAYRNLDGYRAKWRFSTWLFTIARRLAINCRRKKHLPEAAPVEAACSDSPGPDASLMEKENKQKIWNIASNVLTEEQYTAVWLYYVEDMPVKEIAAVLDRYLPATKMILHRARQKLMPALKETEAKHE